MSMNWPEACVADILQLQRRWIKLDPLEKYTEIGIRSFGKGIFHKPPVTGLALGNKRVLRICPGDLVFNNVFAWEGAVAVASHQEAGMIGSHRFITYTIRDGSADAKYLQFFFRTGQGLELVRQVSPGSAGRNRTLNLTQFSNQKIPLPPLSEQRRIVAKIDRLAAKIDEARGLRSHVRSTGSLLWKASASQLLRSLPSHLWRPLGSCVEISGGGTPSKRNPAYWGGEIPWVSPKDMKHREIVGSADHITEAGASALRDSVYDSGCVLVVVRGMILAHTFPAAVLRVRAAINQDMKALSTASLVPEYLCAVLWGLNDAVLSMVDRSTHDTRKLVTPKLAAFSIPLPPLPEQRRIVAYLDSLQAKVDAVKKLQEQSAAELDALLPSILDKAFKGEL